MFTNKNQIIMTETATPTIENKLKKVYLDLKQKPRNFISDLARETNRDEKSVRNWIFSEIKPDEKTQKIIDNFLTQFENETSN